MSLTSPTYETLNNKANMVSCAPKLSILYKEERNEICLRNQKVGEKPGLREHSFEGKIFPALFTQRCRQ